MELSSQKNHPLRLQLANEVHARPFLKISQRSVIIHLGIFNSENPEVHRRLLDELCISLSITPPPIIYSAFFFETNAFTIKWSRHTEFSSFSFVFPLKESSSSTFKGNFSDWLPSDWFNSIQTSLISAVRVFALNQSDHSDKEALIHSIFNGRLLVNSHILSGGEVLCDWKVNTDGFSNMVVYDVDFRERQLGRAVQRLLEIEDYRMMALLALPIAREMAQELFYLESELSNFISLIDSGQSTTDADLLIQLTSLSAKIHKYYHHSSRFSASIAYDDIVRSRIQELRETRIEGYPTVGEFMDRRLKPAIDTCRTIVVRHEQLAKNVSRAADLLRTRVNLVQEKQTNSLLEGMNKTATSQLLMQKAVEGLSVAAISYYIVNLIGVGLKALHHLGVEVDVEVAEFILLFPTVYVVYQHSLAIKKIKVH
ncbi:DUF3422 domain-containing protein [Leeia sp. TBRC 13508]|uniref:DUF3422 domain-containing protein n=1 Tax=Leeia speluncae TaxID=2884804 RepID=A0ABS8DA08_9NEIS|nr:DUF3422 domain-containing protein [Leeia speluncae]MCB6184967.1 DUF3422 domain-containing protein [Leeia speluncae]